MSPEERFAHQICRILDEGARELDYGIAERIRASRERATLSLQPVSCESMTIAGAAGVLGQLRGSHSNGGHPWLTLLTILALVLGVSLAYYWNGFDQATENEEIDSALLSDDLPPNAYLDRGFKAWIAKSHAPIVSPVSAE